MASTTGLDLSISGLASGLDWKTVVSQLAQAERAPETLWKQRQTTISQRNSVFGTIKTYLTSLQSDIQKLKDPTLYDSRAATSSDDTIVTASADTTAVLETFSFNISHLATAARTNGTINVGNPISANGDLTAVTLGTAGFATPITAGTFTINGHQITIATSDTLQQVFDQIASATGNTVTAGYSTSTDKITLTSSNNSEIVLGSATDTSNFLEVAKLYNLGGPGSVTSASALGSVRLTAAMADSGLSTAPSRTAAAAPAHSRSTESRSATTQAPTISRMSSTASTVLPRESLSLMIPSTIALSWPTRPVVTSASRCRT